jgi:hypothetical protein
MTNPAEAGFDHGPARGTGVRCNVSGRPSDFNRVATRALRDSPSADKHPIEGQQYDRADHGSDQTCILIAAANTHRVREKTTEQRTGDPEQYRYDHTARIPSRHDQFRQSADYQSKYDHHQYAHKVTYKVG